jgi:hypothetical protein
MKMRRKARRFTHQSQPTFRSMALTTTPQKAAKKYVPLEDGTITQIRTKRRYGFTCSVSLGALLSTCRCNVVAWLHAGDMPLVLPMFPHALSV